MPGSNPLFGLNALGGAVSVRTKTGFSHPGHAFTMSGGSFGRYVVEGAGAGRDLADASAGGRFRGPLRAGAVMPGPALAPMSPG